jgi:hypothetical protein
MQLETQIKKIKCHHTKRTANWFFYRGKVQKDKKLYHPSCCCCCSKIQIHSPCCQGNNLQMSQLTNTNPKRPSSNVNEVFID